MITNDTNEQLLVRKKKVRNCFNSFSLRLASPRLAGLDRVWLDYFVSVDKVQRKYDDDYIIACGGSQDDQALIFQLSSAQLATIRYDPFQQNVRLNNQRRRMAACSARLNSHF